VIEDDHQDMTPFKLSISDEAAANRDPEWWDVLSTLPNYTWEQSPIKLHQVSANGRPVSNNKTTLIFGSHGVQEAVNKTLIVGATLSLADGVQDDYSYRILLPNSYKCKLLSKTTNGYLSPAKPTVEVELKLRILCTTRIELRIPVVFWRGKADNVKNVFSGTSDGQSVFVCYMESKLQSRPSSRIDIEELLLYKPPVGAGTFGTVYRGVYRDQDVACKVLNFQTEDAALARSEFKMEVCNYESLHHPCILLFYGAVDIPGSLAIVTEFCPYGSLLAAIKKYGPSVWNFGMKLKALYDTARAMNYLHRSSIIHRDLKPDNMLVTSLEPSSPVICKLSDFGMTKGVNSMESTLIQTKGRGTPLYMAPEIMTGETNYTAKVDVFSFGVMMATLAKNGECPYGENGKLAMYPFTMKLIAGMRPEVTEDQAPPEYRGLMRACWNSEAEKRPEFKDIIPFLESMFDKFDF